MKLLHSENEEQAYIHEAEMAIRLPSAESISSAFLLLSSMIGENRYRTMEELMNPEHDPLKSLQYRDSHARVPYFLSNLERYISRQDYEEIILQVWIMGEYSQFDHRDWAAAFDAANRDRLIKAGQKIPKKAVDQNSRIVVYQGGESGDRFHSNSWTLSPLVAKKFALMRWRRFDKDGNVAGYHEHVQPTVYKAVIELDDVLVYTNRANEQEVIIRTDKIPCRAEVGRRPTRQGN